MIIIEIIISLIMLYLSKQIIDVQKEKQEQYLKEQEPVKILVEVIDNTYYAWLFDEDKFIMQSPNKEQFVSELLKKFPDKNINLLSKEKIEWSQKSTI